MPIISFYYHYYYRLLFNLFCGQCACAPLLYCHIFLFVFHANIIPLHLTGKITAKGSYCEI